MEEEVRGLVFLIGFALAIALGVLVAPILFVVVGLATVVWWQLTKPQP